MAEGCQRRRATRMDQSSGSVCQLAKGMMKSEPLLDAPPKREAAEFAATLEGRVDHVVAGTLDRAVALAARDAEAAKLTEAVVLLSPACASFDQFPNFEVRGKAFRDLVRALPGVEGN